MRTTNLLVELLVVGVWAWVWVAPLLAAESRETAISLLRSLPDGLGLVVAFAAVYVLGMAINLAADLLTKPVDRWVANKHGGKGKLHRHRARLLVHAEAASDYALQRRSLVRIFRATLLNAVLGSVVLLFDIGGARSSLGMGALSAGLVCLVVIVGLAYAFFRTLNGYFAFLVDANAELEPG